MGAEGHRQFNELKAKRLPWAPDQKLMATPVTSAQAVKAWERASRCSAALEFVGRRRGSQPDRERTESAGPAQLT